jgi:hypothetical protein
VQTDSQIARAVYDKITASITPRFPKSFPKQPENRQKKQANALWARAGNINRLLRTAKNSECTGGVSAPRSAEHEIKSGYIKWQNMAENVKVPADGAFVCK